MLIRLFGFDEYVHNIQTTVDMQGTGTIRATVFALLRYKALRKPED